VLVLEDVVFGGAVAQALEGAVNPPAQGPAITRVMRAVAGGFGAVGADPEFGLKLPAALTAAGLRDVHTELTFRLVHGGSEESVFYDGTVRQLAPQLISAGLLTRDDADLAAVLIQDPAARWFSLGIVSAWGLRP
jgi:hypothetical protein